ncbi:11329_t:CDS:2 [Acaulospora colombiana]|uniref:11329_t:CDS:1 n=1 Tax=Acaulospora colombiana TaxID=27376 RepID=A0ACA9M0K9_9GLOM|nr:11329_t:CDS:2 [Acaulospora colombiana]
MSRERLKPLVDTPVLQPTRSRRPAQPKVTLPRIKDIRSQLKRLNLPTSINKVLWDAYRGRAKAVKSIVSLQLKAIWTDLNRSERLTPKERVERFHRLAKIHADQLSDGYERLYDSAVDAILSHIDPDLLKKNTKFDTRWVPVLQWIFENTAGRYPSQRQKRTLARNTTLTYRQITVWFQNRRARQKKRNAMIAAGQLPTEAQPESITDSPEQPPEDDIEWIYKNDILVPRYHPDGRLPFHRWYERCKFPVTEWPRQAYDGDGLMSPVNNGEMIILYRSFNNLHVVPCEPPPEVAELCKHVNSIDLETPDGGDTPQPDDEADHGNDDAPSQSDDTSLETFEADDSSFEGLDPELESDDSTSGPPMLDINPLDHLLPLPSTRAIAPRRRRKPKLSSRPSQPKRATAYNIFPKKAGKFKLVPKQPRLLSKEDSQRVLRNGVGKVPLVRVHFRTPSKMEPPPVAPKSSEVKQRQTDRIMVVSGRLVRVRPKKSLPPAIREVPSLSPSSLGNLPTTTASHTPYDVQHDDFPSSQTSWESPDNEMSSSDAQQDAAFKPDDDDYSESSPSCSGSSHYDSDYDELLVASCMEGVSLSFNEPHEVLEPAQPLELPECFQIPYDPDIAEVALNETLQAFGISVNYLAPVGYNALDHQAWKIEYGADQCVDLEATMMPVDLQAWNASFYAEEPTIDPPAEVASTFIDDYLSALPTLTEGSSYNSSESFAALQAGIEATLSARGLGSTPEVDPSDLSSLFEVLPPSEPPFPPTDDYGDGSQFLVQFEDEEPCGEPFIPIFTEEDFLPDSERYPQVMPCPFDPYMPGSESQWLPAISQDPTQFWQDFSLDTGLISGISAHTLNQPSTQPMPHLPLTSLVESGGTEALPEESGTTAQNFLEFLASLPGSLVSTVTSLVASGSNTGSSRPKSTPSIQRVSPVDFSDTDDFKREITEYANLRIYGTTTSPYDDPNPPVLW